MLPALFVSHGAPSLLLENVAARDFLRGLGKLIDTPRAIVAISAHAQAKQTMLNQAARFEAFHDFYGFPAELYQQRYDVAGAPAVAARAVELLDAAGIVHQAGADARIDHGFWCPLKLMYPAAEIPLVPLITNRALNDREYFELGRALRPLRAQGVLLLASGSATHNLREFGRYPLQAEPAGYAREFADWLQHKISGGDIEAVLDWQAAAPHALRNHPTPEHFRPLLWAMGAGDAGQALHRSYTYGFMAMDAYRFD